MTAVERASALAPFRVRSFRFQWPADLATSCAFETETLILGWYVLVATGSVQSLVVIAALAWIGTLFSPLMAIAGDRLGVRNLLCATRGLYALLAGAIAALALTGSLAPWHVFVIAGIAGLLKPSDMAMRHVLVAWSMRPEVLVGALGISRTTVDIARMGGAIAGTAGVALIGLGAAYAVVTAMYLAAFLLSLGVAPPPRGKLHSATLSRLAEAVAYVWRTPGLLGAFAIAFLVNLLAFPFFLGLLPYAAKDVFQVGQSGLGYLAAAFWLGALAGSLAVGANRLPLRAARVMLCATALWFATIFVFGQVRSMAPALALLFGSGFVHSFCMTPLLVVMLRTSNVAMRGPVMGMRMLAIWGLPLGLLAAGPIIQRLGFAACVALYSALGLAATVAIGYRLRGALWRRAALANAAV